ncbi:MAG: tRNA (adenosine(37)-N6)-dimethylallyltransferase MiaA [Bacteroidales bacterium]|nr:tRNA (adenosine(37)-N6)-dimethylallyltransferase MiaA [Candidatus Sodaliphilus fimicaballi]
MNHQHTLIVITGPTAVGKTRVSIELARTLGCDIVNADSRQIFRHIPICTAAPTAEEQALAKHHFVEFRELDEYYSAAQYEADVMHLLPTLWQHSDYVVMCGGSMMYVDAVCRGIDEIPNISDDLRARVLRDLDNIGLEGLLAELEIIDPEYYAQVDKCNTRRVVHAIEICRQTGVPYSSLRTGQAKQRDFNIVKIGLNMERPLLFDRINRRVDLMMEQGLEQEARSVLHLRHLNSLNTVGMKEMFAYFDGTMDYVTARERIKKNTRVYAKKQLTWLARYPSIKWLHPATSIATILDIVKQS